MATYVPLTRADGGTVIVNPETVDDLQDVPPSLNPGPAACFVSFTGADGHVRVAVLGTAAAIAALLASGGGAAASSGTYAPTFSGLTGLSAAVIAPAVWRWQRIGDEVQVFGSAVVTLNPGPGAFGFEVDGPFPFNAAPGSSAVAVMHPVPATPAPEAPAATFNTALTIGVDCFTSGLYPTARVEMAFSYLAQP